MAEFEHHPFEEELDLMREASNASQLRRNSRLQPARVSLEVHWGALRQRVMVMERMQGTPISQVQSLAGKRR